MLVEGLAVEANDPVAARLFRHVQRVVGSFHEGITVVDARVRPGRDATAHGALERPPIESERVRLYCFTHALGEGNGRIEHRPRQQQHKLFSTIPTDAIDLSRLLFQDPGELLQHGVAGLMAVGVVHTLEAIQITQHHRHRLVQAARMAERLLQALLDVASIIEAGQRIGLRHLEQLSIDLRQLAFAIFERILQRLDAQHRLHARLELGEVDRLRDVVVRPGIQSFDLVLGGIERGLKDDRNERQVRVCLDPSHHLEAIDARHHDVEQDQIGW